VLLPLAHYRYLLATYLGPLRTKVAGMFALLLVGLGLKLVNPLVIRYFIDAAQTGGTLQSLTTAGLLFLGVGLVVEALSIAASYLGTDIGLRASDALRTDLIRHALRLDPDFHHVHRPGEMIERIDGDVSGSSLKKCNYSTPRYATTSVFLMALLTMCVYALPSKY